MTCLTKSIAQFNNFDNEISYGNIHPLVTVKYTHLCSLDRISFYKVECHQI